MTWVIVILAIVSISGCGNLESACDSALSECEYSCSNECDVLNNPDYYSCNSACKSACQNGYDECMSW